MNVCTVCGEYEKDCTCEAQKLRERIAVLEHALRLAHDKMHSWFSSEYADHPDTIKVRQLLDGMDVKTELATLQAQVSRYRTALESIAKPALGGKQQQWTAQQALKHDETS